MRRLDDEGRIDFDSPDPDPDLHIDYVWTKGPGRMFGVLVCAGPGGTRTVLKAFSGQMTNKWHVPGWAGPVAGVTNATPLYQAYRSLTALSSASFGAAMPE
ncbi:hypothetical protein GPECTOR_20g521 [Gonium pectorale]|uniref:Uncharacterized protein n=1 Tax=Gonium pectorale TaxID=33097 RepID=A0A150GIP2_GONPE|nr:hypothetical protein GPECTOR_20g521 [Gonium pectorale]|eukprot:KXZ49664.1 hypothetical protein GPECTOR_20g521 [Gonium pectorale]